MKASTRALLAGLGATGSAAVAYRFFLSPKIQTWGATPEEVARPMPGDELVPTPMFQATHAITIEAPAEAIWPWLLQIGYGRAGFYSYARLERAMGLTGIHNADAILPQFQRLELGDTVPFGPGESSDKPVGLEVAALEPYRHLTLAMRQKDGAVTWAFSLYPIDTGHTRLVSRNLGYMPEWTLASILTHPTRWRTELPMKLFINLGGFLMVRKMLGGVKCRAERLHAEVATEEQALVLSSGCE